MSGGVWEVEYCGPNGERWSEKVRNMITTSGLRYALEAIFTWSAGSGNFDHPSLIFGSGGDPGLGLTEYSGVSLSDTEASHPGWVIWSFSHMYIDAGYPVAIFGTAANNSVSFVRSLSYTFDFNRSGIANVAVVLRGIALYTTGGDYLFSTALFSEPRTVSSGGVLRVNYTLAIAGGTTGSTS